MAVKTSWSSGDVLTAADLTDTFAAKLDASAYTPGLSLITTQSFSAVSSVSVNNCFTGDYDNYRVLYRLTGASSTNAPILLRLRLSGSDASGSNYGYQQLTANGATVGAAVDSQGNTTYFVGYGSSVSPAYAAASIEMFGPGVSQPTLLLTHQHQYTSTNLFLHLNSGYHTASTAYDGFTLYPASGTITGSVSVYGYKK